MYVPRTSPAERGTTVEVALEVYLNGPRQEDEVLVER